MDARHRLIDVAAANDYLRHRSDVTLAGVTSAEWCRLVLAGEWIELAPTVWCHAATPATWELRIRAGARWLGPRAALFGRTAAAWWGLDGARPDTVEFVTPRVRRGLDPRYALHTTTRWDQRDILTHRGVRTVGVTRTIIDLASDGQPARAIEAAIDSGVRMRLTTVPRIVERMNRLAATRLKGVRLLRELLLDSGGESVLERRLLQLLRSAGLPRPRCQVIHRSPGGPVRRVDFEFTAARVIVEVSGRLGHSSDADRRRDARRRNQLQHDGFMVLEFTTADVLDDPDYVLSTIRRELASASGATA